MQRNAVEVRKYSNFINGEWVESGSGRFIPRISPIDGQVVAEYADSTEEETKKAIQAAREAFEHGPWPQMSGIERSQVLYRLAQKVRENFDQLSLIEAEEVGKTIRMARGDINGVIALTDYAAALAMQIHGESYNNLGTKYSATVVREPVGVVGLIIPWNFPALIYSQKMPFALAAGCTVVVKPSEFTSGTTLEISRLADEAGVPKGVINVVTGYGHTVGQTIVESPNIDRISFTGSTATGQKILHGAVDSLKRVSLELGGKSANIVFADADLEDAIDGTLFGIFMNQGECCCAGSRLLIEESIADQFVDRLVERARQLKVGNPLDEKTDIGALIHEKHLQKVLEYIKEGKKEGATLLTGGNQVNEYANGCFVEPTLFDHVSQEMKIFQEEIFGPVLAITRFKDIDEAISLANATQYGLAGAVWTKDIDKAHFVSRALRSGTVWVNTIIDGSPQLPFGGYKASGYGREMGNIGIEEFTELKAINIHLGKRTPFFK